MPMPRDVQFRAGAFGATALRAGVRLRASARADDTSTQIGTTRRQIQALQGQLDHMKHDPSARSADIVNDAWQAAPGSAVGTSSQTSGRLRPPAGGCRPFDRSPPAPGRAGGRP